MFYGEGVFLGEDWLTVTKGEKHEKERKAGRHLSWRDWLTVGRSVDGFVEYIVLYICIMNFL